MKSCKPISVGLFYSPPDSNDVQLNLLLNNISKHKSDNMIIISDFNYGKINWKNNTSNEVGKKFLKVSTNLSLLQCVKDTTRGNNILDLVFVYNKNFIYQIRQMAPLAKSDHNILSISLNVTVKIKKTSVQCYSYNKANYNKLDAMISKIEWEDEMRRNSVNDN